MGQFLLWSLIASVVLTVLLNLLPTLFPKLAARAERRISDAASAGSQKRVRVIFPWKSMLLLSLFLTVGLNILFVLVR